MRKIYALLTAVLCFFVFSVKAQITVTVTGNTNTTPNLLASYPNLAAALTDLNNVTAMTGPVSMALSGTEPAPATGYTIGSATLNPVLSSTNTVTFTGPATLTAGVGTATPASAAPDGILKLNGADYITIDGLTFTDGNTTNPASMEFGLGFFKRSAGDGCNNNTIQNCIFNMQSVNNALATAPMLDGAVGILVINSTSAAATTALTPTNGGTLATNGTNSGNRFYTNTINGGNYGIGISGYAASSGVGPAPTATTFLGDLNNDIGGAAAGTGNTILNFGGAPSAANAAAGIRANNVWSINISYNNINSNNGSGANHATNIRGIYAQAGTSANATINNNTISVKCSGTTASVYGVDNAIGGTAASNTVTINNNIIQNSTFATATTGSFYGINSAATATTITINSNQVINNTIGTSGSANSCIFYGIYNQSASTNFTANSNTISNNILANSYGSIYCIRGNTSTITVDGNTISNNTIPNSSGATSSLIYGYYDVASPVIETITNNNINNLSITGNSTATGHAIYGIYNVTAAGAKTFSGNNINTLTFNSSGAGYSSVMGIRNPYTATSNIFNNTIHTLSSTGITPTVAGLYLGSTTVTTINAYNNIIGNLTTPQSTGHNLYGIYCGSVGTNYNLYYNTVYLSGTSSGTGFASSAVFMSSTTPTVTMQNNHLVNLCTPTGTGITAVLRRVATAMTGYSTTSNNNLFYAGTPSATNVIYYDGTASYGTNTSAFGPASTAGTFQNVVTPRESVSVTETVSNTAGVYYQSLTGPATGNSSTFLHMVAGLSTKGESGGTPVAGITTDYDGQTRNASFPDMGADEFTGVAVDNFPPTITYTALSNSCGAGARTLVATITDPSGIPSSAGTAPRLYWKINAGAYSFEEGSSIGGNQFQFTTLGTGSVVGDVISYYIVAQDGAGTPNVGAFPSTGAAGLTANPPAAATPPTTPSSYTNLATLAGTYTVGSGGSYATLTAAVNDYNAKCVSGPIIFELTDATYNTETYPIKILSNVGASATNTLTIRPAASIVAPIAFKRSMNGTANNEATFYLSGARYVTIDGRPGGAGSNQYIIIEDTATTAAAAGNAILLANEASNNTLTYLDVRSGNANLANSSSTVPTAGSVPGAIAILSTSGANGNDNNVISFCNVHDTGTVAAAASLGVGIYMMNATAAGTAANNDNNTVTNCNIYDVFLPSSNSAAINIAPGNNTWTISNNSIYQTATRTYTGTQTVRGLWITPNTGSVAGATGTISGNFIGGSAPSCGGTAMTMTGTSAWLYQTMDISTGNTAATSIQGNTINNINMTTASTSTTAFQGIGTANGTVNIGNVTGNTIGNPAVNSAPYGITFTTTGTLGGITAIRVGGGSTGPHVVSNNAIGGIELIGNATTVAPSFVGILNAVSTANTISNNTIGSATLPNSINLSATSATSTSVSLTRGISVTTGLNTTISNNLVANINSNYSGTGSGNTVTGLQVSSGAATVSGNTIRNLYSASQSTGGGTTAGIMGISYSSTTAPAVISGNTIFALKNTHPTTTAAIANQAIAYGGPTTGNNLIEKNNIHSIALSSPTNSAGTLSGMDIATGLVTIQNNMIRLGLDSNGASIISPCLVRGITKNTATAKIFHNSIYIGGTGVGTTATNTFAFVRTATASIDSVMDNIFVNNRSNATTGGKHYQINLNATATLVVNNNVYYGTGTGNVFGYNGTADVAAHSNGWIASDVNSFNGDPIFINATGNAGTGDLHINPAIASVAEGLGAALPTPVTDDIDNQTRVGLTPVDIGADAGNFTPVAVMAYSSSTTTQSNTTNVPNNSVNQQVIGIEVVTTGLVNPLSVTSVTINTNGTTNTGNIANAKLFYTNNSSTFATTTQVGSTIAAPTGSFNITGTQTLSSGTNYFWLTYDVPCGATVGNTIDAECTSITIGSAQTPTVTDPGSGRQIIAGPLSGTKTVGGGGTPDYATLTAAIAAVNSFGLGGNLTLNIMGNITEAGQVVIPQWTECGGSGFTLTIKPNTTASISGAVASGALIKLNGADNVIIDGSNSGGTDRSLTITNTSTTSPTAVSLASLGTGLGATNNTIKNCSISTGVSTATGYGIAVGGATPGASGADNDNVTLQNNNITVATIGIYAAGTASVSAGGMDNLTITGNSIDYNGTIASIGIQAGNALNSTITQNTVSEQSTATFSPTGISLETGFVSSTVLRNTITKSVTTNTGGYGGRGITVGTGTATSNLTIANNVIYGVNGTNWTGFSNSSSMGIGIGMVGNSSTITTTSGGINLYYNSVNMYGTYSSTSACITAALYIGSAASALDIRNNIFVNTLNNTGTGTTSKAYAIYSAAANTAFTTINYNLYDTAATQGMLGFLTSDRGDIAAWRTASGQDVNSIAADPIFNSNTGLQPQTGSPAGAAGTLVSVTVDFNGTARSGTNPTIGAYETLGDGIVPSISYSTLGNSLCTGNRALSATITDVSGINNTAGTKPRIYYKKSTNLNALGGTNDNTTNGWKYTEATNGSSPYSFNIDVSLIFGGVAAGDNVQYFVSAQDNAGTPNVGINSGTFNAIPASVNLTGTAFPIGGTINNYTLLTGGISGTVTVGAVASTYPSITGTGGLFETLNNGGLLGNVTVLLNDATLTEPGTVALNSVSYGCASNYTLTIKPNTGVNTVVTGAVGTGAVIKLNGADYVTIDGSNNGSSSRNLTIRNTTTTTSGNAAVWLASPATGNGATNNTIKNCIIEGDAATTTFTGIHVGGSTSIGLATAGTELNSNNTFDNNLFRKSQYGLTMFGYGAATPDLNNVISNNNFGTATAGEGFSLIAINADRQSGLIVSGNEIQNVTNASTSATFVGGMRLLDFKNGLCYNNKVHDLVYTGTSTPKYYGIGVTSSTYTTVGNPSNAQVYNNLVYKINSTGTSGVWNVTGILASAGYGDKFYYNSVHLTGQVANSSSGFVAAFANGDGNVTSVGTNIDVRNNIFSLTGSSATAGGNFWAYYTAATTLTGSVLNYNDLYCNGTGATNNVGRFNGTNYATLAAWQTATTQDANSIAVDPQYNSTTNLAPQLGSPVLSAGTPVSVTTDILGTVRSITTPSMGAYETGGDAAAPVITYTALAGTCATGNRQLTATITDASGVPTSGILTPRIYYKKGILGSFYSQPGSLSSGTATNGSWTFDIVAADMGGLATNDTVYYFVVAQDIVGTPNIGSNPSGVVAVNVNSITTPPAPLFYKIQSTLAGTYNVGIGQAYTTLTAAVNAYNNSCITGPVEFVLTDANYAEAGQLVINNPAYASATNTLYIHPAVEFAANVTASVASGPVVKILSGYVTIDGYNGSTPGNSLTITNINTTSPIVVLIGSTGTTPITNVTLRNTNIINSNITSGTAVLVSDATTLGNPGYFNNINIVGDSIQKAYTGVYAIAVVQAGNGSGLRIDSNLLNKSGANSIAFTGIYVQGVDGATVSGNNIGNFDGTSAQDDNGIWFATGTVNSTINRNNITNLAYTGTSGYGGHGIYITTGLATSGIKVINNMIAGMSGDGFAYTGSFVLDNPIGIALSGTQGGIEVYNNSINLTGNTLNQTNAMSMGIYLGAGSVANIRNNIIVNNLGLLSATGYGSAGIYAVTANTQFTAINYNDYVVNPTGSGGKYFGQIAAAGATTLAAWQTASGGDANSLNILPVFVSATNLHLVAGSNCTLHRMGTPIAGLTKDFDNDDRNVTYPDMGADEYLDNIAGTFTWTGTVNTDWFNPANWNNCREIPGTTSNVVINGSLTNYPLVTGNVIIKSLTLNSGATVTVATGFDIKLLGP